jgi:hypothetical protein
MPQVTLAASNVAYNLFSKLNTADPQIQQSVQGLQIQVPASVAANAGALVKIGRPDSRTSPTTISSAEVELNVGDSYLFPAEIGNDISLAERWVNASVANCVLYCSVVQA